jgi:hypothetical protein
VKSRAPLPLVLAAIPSALIAVGLVVSPQQVLAKSSFASGMLWAILLFVAMTGYGAALARVAVPGRRVDVGLRLAWGGAVLAFLGGVLAMASLYRRDVALGLVDVGLAFAIWDLFRRRDERLPQLRLAWRAMRRNRSLSILLAICLGVTALHFLAAAGDDSTNQYDDDIAYFALVKRLVQTGSMIEPFSFRRLSALGGQPFFLSLLYPRANFQEMNLFDRGICVAGIVFLILGYRRNGRRPPGWLLVLTLAFFLGLPHITINTAGHFSGVLFFLALFRTLLFLAELPPPPSRLSLVRRALPPALVAVAACTLRQNFLAPAIVTVVASEAYVAFSRAGVPWRERLERPVAVGAIAALAIAPWMVLSYRSNLTPLYPLVLGTYNPALVLESNLLTWLDEIRFFIWIAVENEPIRSMVIFVVAGLLVREAEPTKPLRSLWVGTALGYAVLSHTLSQGDPGNLARYLFGFLTALAIATILTAGATWHRAPRGANERFVQILVVAAIGLQLVVTRPFIFRRYDALVSAAKQHLHDAPESAKTLRTETFVYAKVEDAIPRGAKVAFMVDEPYYLDFTKHDLFNIDMPGYASPAPGLPYFQGPQAKAQYFKGLGIHHLLFVRSQSSRAHYKRDFWFHRMFAEEEIWRLFTPYQIDMIDDLAELARTHKILYEERGIVALDLDAPP